LFHDVGKPLTAADGHFYRHEVVGADVARSTLERLHFPRSTVEAVAHLVRQHMFHYEPSWSDAAVRRFLGKVRPAAVEDLFALRAADNIGSGVAPEADDLPALRARVAAELAAGPLLDRSALAIDGTDVIRELGVAPGPEVGRVLELLFERVVEDPRLNERSTLLAIGREVAGQRDAPPNDPRPPTAPSAADPRQ
ncbi:MAG TPA: HD domain-containing protein, partial [Candidatus Limnocylindrales bacterium]|nr:HD domain-containing protein [Candidatus Limnocylindrales bacterium]